MKSHNEQTAILVVFKKSEIIIPILKSFKLRIKSIRYGQIDPKCTKASLSNKLTIYCFFSIVFLM